MADSDRNEWLGHIKWHAERLRRLLEQNPEYQDTTALWKGVTDYFGHTSTKGVEAEVPPGVYEDQE